MQLKNKHFMNNTVNDHFTPKLDLSLHYKAVDVFIVIIINVTKLTTIRRKI